MLRGNSTQASQSARMIPGCSPQIFGETLMDAIKRILIPTDFSPHADAAFRVAHTLARAIGAEVVLFHIAHTPAVASEGGRLLTDPGTGKTSNLWDRFQNILPNDSRVRI